MTDAVQSLTIQGLKFQIAAPYAKGHLLSEQEAAALNQLFSENIRNNCANLVKEAKDAAGDSSLSDAALDELGTKIDDYASKYTFAGKRQSRTPVDPIARMIERLAREAVTEAARAKGHKVKEWPDGKMEKLVEMYIAKYPAITEEAKRRIEAQKTLAASAADVEGIDDAPAVE